MRARLSVAVMGVILVLALTSVSASSPNAKVKFALHLVPHGNYICTKSPPVIGGFSDITREVASWDSLGLDVFLVVFDYDSLSLIEYGLTWPTEWGSASTQVCLQRYISVGTITSPGDGMAYAWMFTEADCSVSRDLSGGNTAPFFVPSYSWMVPTGPGEIRIKDDPPTEMVGVVDCRSEVNRGYEYVTHVYDAGVQTVPHDGPYPGACYLIPDLLDFETVTMGRYSDRTFTLGNNGSSMLSGSLTRIFCALEDYSIVGDNSYSLKTGETKQFKVRFAPTETGLRECAIDLGNDHCNNVKCVGMGSPPVSTEPATWGTIKAIFR